MPLLTGFAVLVGCFLVVPTFIVIPLSFSGEKSYRFPPESWSTRWYENLFEDPAWREAALTSLQVAAIVTVVAVALGTAAALALDRGRIPGRRLAYSVVLSPMIAPVVVIAVGIYALFLRWQLIGSVEGFAIAHVVLALPFVVVPVMSSLATFDRSLERAAASLGAGPLDTFRNVTFPIIRPGVAIGALFAFLTSFDEVVVSLFLATPDASTLPVLMFQNTQRDADPTVAAVSTVIFLGTTCVLIATLLLQTRRTRRGR